MSLLGASLATFAAAQQLTLSPSLATPGQVVTASLFNDTGGLLAVADTCEATLLWHSGELAEGLLVLGQACDALVAISAGQTHTWQFLAPSSPGTFLATFDPAIGNRAVARLDVTAASASPQQLAFFPKGIHFPHSAHQADFSDPASLPWQLSNVGSAAHTFGPNDRIEITVPGGTQVLRTLSLDTLLVGAGKAVDVYLPIAGLTPGPYTVVAIFQDPGTGGEVRTRAGIQQRASRVDLHRMGRRTIAIGETTEFGFTLAGFPTPGDVAPYYFLLVGGLPGTTTLPGGKILPLQLDGLVAASANGQIPGLSANNVGTLPNQYPGGFFFHAVQRGITMTHPGIPAASGLVLRVAVFGLDAGLTVWEASQGEEFELL